VTHTLEKAFTVCTGLNGLTFYDKCQVGLMYIYKVTLQDNKKHIEKRYTLAIAINKFTKLQL